MTQQIMNENGQGSQSIDFLSDINIEQRFQKLGNNF